jgi:hypothetical protein
MSRVARYWQGKHGAEAQAPYEEAVMNETNRETALTAFERYSQAFQTLDAQAVPPHFGAPALMIVPHATLALPDAAAVARAYAPVMADASAKGYARTDFFELSERRLSDDLAVVTGSGAWLDRSGRKLSSFGLSYTFRLVDGAWRIVVALIHDAKA